MLLSDTLKQRLSILNWPSVCELDRIAAGSHSKPTPFIWRDRNQTTATTISFLTISVVIHGSDGTCTGIICKLGIFSTFFASVGLRSAAINRVAKSLDVNAPTSLI